MFLSHDMSRATSQGHDSKVMDLSNTLVYIDDSCTFQTVTSDV